MGAGAGRPSPFGGLPAFLRILPQEVPGCVIDSVETDAAALGPPPATATSATTAPDVFGARVRGGAAELPRLCVREPGTAQEPQRVDATWAGHLQGNSIVTGGLGSLGMLCALWLTGTAGPGARLALLGRSGRAGHETPISGRLMRCGALITAFRADVSSASEVQGLLHVLSGPTASAPIKVRPCSLPGACKARRATGQAASSCRH